MSMSPPPEYSRDEQGKWWYKPRRGKFRVAAKAYICPNCKIEFLSPDYNRVYCSHKCAAAAHHKRQPVTTIDDGGSLKNSGNPRYSRDKDGQWWYVSPKGKGRTRAYIKQCARCQDNFLSSIFHAMQVHCSRSCGIRASNEAAPDRFKGKHGGRWKGGRRIDDRGYVLVWSPNHPSPRKVAGIYMFEHRLVMEKMLGRYLETHETVHHKNGIRDDNRPENLELWTRAQPYGVRATELRHCPTCTCSFE